MEWENVNASYCRQVCSRGSSVGKVMNARGFLEEEAVSVVGADGVSAVVVVWGGRFHSTMCVAVSKVDLGVRSQER